MGVFSFEPDSEVITHSMSLIDWLEGWSPAFLDMTGLTRHGVIHSQLAEYAMSDFVDTMLTPGERTFGHALSTPPTTVITLASDILVGQRPSQLNPGTTERLTERVREVPHGVQVAVDGCTDDTPLSGEGSTATIRLPTTPEWALR